MFSLRSATCFDAAERAHLLEVIAAGCGSHAAFERMLKTTLLDAPGARRNSFTAIGDNLTRMRSSKSVSAKAGFVVV